jgi:hypothetical protein
MKKIIYLFGIIFNVLFISHLSLYSEELLNYKSVTPMDIPLKSPDGGRWTFYPQTLDVIRDNNLDTF